MEEIRNKIVGALLSGQKGVDINGTWWEWSKGLNPDTDSCREKAALKKADEMITLYKEQE